MEPDAAHDAFQTPTAAAGHRKHLAMLDRLSKRTTNTSSSSSAAAAAAFLSCFAASKRAIESSLSSCRAAAASGGDVKSELAAVSAAIDDLERLVAESSYSLPSYEVRAALGAIADLRDSHGLAKAELLPKKSFAFKNKAPKKDKDAILAAPAQEKSNLDAILATPAQEIGENNTSEVEKSNLDAVKNCDERLDLGALSATPGFRSKKGTTLVKDFRVSEETESDFTLADLDSCEVYLKGRFRALYIHKLRSCRVFVGPVLGSVLIEDVQGCLFVMASHQIRIHEARATDFYLRVRSRPIIEDSSGVRFAPYALAYEGIDAELRDSGLAEETGNWTKVDDFKWLRAVQSPNWCLIPEEERLGTVDISEVQEQPAVSLPVVEVSL